MATHSMTLPGYCVARKYNASTGRLESETTYGNPNAYRYTDTKTDLVRRRKPKVWRMPTTYDRDITLLDGPRGKNFAKNSPLGSNTLYDGNLSGRVQYGPNELSSQSFIPPSLKQRAEVKALTKLKDQNLNLGVAYAERATTAQLVGDTAFRFARAAMALKKGNFREVARQLDIPRSRKLLNRRVRNVPKEWLGLQYAWKPLLSDIYGASKQLQGRPFSDWVVTVKGTAVDQIDNVVYDPGGDPSVASNYRHTGFKGVKVRLDYIPTDKWTHEIASLGLTNPLLIAWELVPFSFVVDWVLPIGDWLNTLDATLGYTFLSGSYTERCQLWQQVTPSHPSKWGNGRIFADYEGTNYRSITRRRVYPSSPLPRPPSPKNPLSLGHMANGLSLMATVFGGRR
jgi:hypothetical protein